MCFYSNVIKIVMKPNNIWMGLMNRADRLDFSRAKRCSRTDTCTSRTRTAYRAWQSTRSRLTIAVNTSSGSTTGSETIIILLRSPLKVRRSLCFMSDKFNFKILYTYLMISLTVVFKCKWYLRCPAKMHAR